MGSTFLRVLVCSLGILTLLFAFVGVASLLGTAAAAFTCLALTLVPLVLLLRLVLSADDDA